MFLNIFSSGWAEVLVPTPAPIAAPAGPAITPPIIAPITGPAFLTVFLTLFHVLLAQPASYKPVSGLTDIIPEPTTYCSIGISSFS